MNTLGSSLDRLGRVLLRGVGQIIFQGHAGTGLLFLAGIAVTSRTLLLGALLGALVGPLTARLLRYDQSEIADGIFGYNATLVGIATLFYLDPHQPVTWWLLVGGAVVSVVLTEVLRRRLPFPAYTSAFIVTIWLVLMVAHGLDGTTIDHKPEPAGSHRVPRGFVGAMLAGEAEIMFGANVWTGLLFLAGIAWSNGRHALLTLIGTLVGTALAVYHNDPQETITIGIYGYNAALAALGIYLWRPSLLLPILAALVSVPLTEFFPKLLGIPALTAPFVLACWLLIAIGSLERRLPGA
jgi:urea transporter